MIDQILASSGTIPFIMGFTCGFLLTAFVGFTVMFGLERMIYTELSRMRKEILKLERSDNGGSLPSNIKHLSEVR